MIIGSGLLPILGKRKVKEGINRKL